MTINRIELEGPKQSFLVDCLSCKEKGLKLSIFESIDTGMMSGKLADFNAAIHEVLNPKHSIIIYKFHDRSANLDRRA